MALHHKETNQEYGITITVFDHLSYGGKFKARISCAVTGSELWGVEGCKTLPEAIASGKNHARQFYH